MKKPVFLFSGPSGVGKSTLINFALESFPNIGTTVSCTTREKRSGEIDGVNYHFITNETFSNFINQGKFLEYVECYGNKYGTLKQSIEDVLLFKDACILDLDFAGAYNLISNNITEENIIGILILPPSLRSLENRLINRKSENSETLIKRLNESFNIKKIAHYKHIIINKSIEESKKDLLNIISKYGIHQS